MALLFSAYNLWQAPLRPSSLRMFVPPVINFASPFQNSNFEAFAIPITITNEGARTGTVLSMTLTVTDPAKNTPEFWGWTPAFEKDHAPPKGQSGMTSRKEVITL